MAGIRSLVSPARATIGLVLASALLVAFLEMRTPLGAQGAPVVVQIGGSLQPANVTVAPGTVVRWDNTDSKRHRVRSTSGPAEFDGDLQPGQSFSFTFTAVGTYQYRDDRAPSLSNYWGTVTVAASSTPTPTSTPAGGATATATPGTSTAGPAEVTMAGRIFSPGALSVAAGSVVTFRNNDTREHTVTARDGGFDSGVLAIGGTFVKTFTSAGTLSYFCALHPDMTGTVTVGGGAPTAGTATATPSATPRAATAADVSIIDFGFAPAEFSVAVGGTVSWANNGVALHTVTARDGSFDSGYITAGGTFSRTFATAGTYQYLCSLHSNMTGSIVVGATPGAPPPPVVTPTARAAPPSDVRAVEFGFEPAQLKVDVGATVTWANAGVAPHTVTARDGSFDSGTLKPGATFSRKFDRPGTFSYLCGLHADMTGTVVVPDASGVAPPPQAPPPRAAPRSTPVPGGPEIADVEMVDFGFSPQTVQIALGGVVHWVNSGVAPHTATAPDGTFDSGYVHPGEEFTRKFTSEGTFNYLCQLHPGMVGAVVVGKAGAAPAPTSAAKTVTTGVSPPAGAADTPASGRVEAEMRDFVFEPVHVVVRAGSTVVWKNAGVAPHTVSARDGSFSSGLKNAGEAFEFRFNRPGEFEYFCAMHPNMVGTVEVVAATGVAGAAGKAGDGRSSGDGGDGNGVSLVMFLVTVVLALGLGATLTYMLLTRPARARGTGP